MYRNTTFAEIKIAECRQDWDNNFRPKDQLNDFWYNVSMEWKHNVFLFYFLPHMNFFTLSVFYFSCVIHCIWESVYSSPAINLRSGEQMLCKALWQPLSATCCQYFFSFYPANNEIKCNCAPAKCLANVQMPIKCARVFLVNLCMSNCKSMLNCSAWEV